MYIHLLHFISFCLRFYYCPFILFSCYILFVVSGVSVVSVLSASLLLSSCFHFCSGFPSYSASVSSVLLLLLLFFLFLFFSSLPPPSFCPFYVRHPILSFTSLLSSPSCCFFFSFGFPLLLVGFLFLFSFSFVKRGLLLTPVMTPLFRDPL